MIAEKVSVKLFASSVPGISCATRTSRLFIKQAGVQCVLMGMETTDPKTQRKIRKGSTTWDDQLAIRLLRENGVLSMVGHIVGFEQERLRDYWNAFRQLLLYDPDLINAMYVTPHRWTPFYRDNLDRAVVQGNRSRLDYRHQVLGTRYLKPWQILTLVKLTELFVQMRPRAVARLAGYADPAQRRAFRWCMGNARGVRFDEIYDFLFRNAHERPSASLRNFWGAPIAREAPLTPKASEATPFHRIELRRNSPKVTSTNSRP